MVAYYLSRVVFKTLRILRMPKAKDRLIRNFPTVFFNPHMEKSEFRLFRKLTREKKVFLEYGSGGSTIYLIRNRKKVFSVESNPDFYKFMCSMDIVKKAINQHLVFRFINIGPTNKWGKPVSDSYNENWPNYYEQIWTDIAQSNTKVDVIFIDGRFRVCCCLYSILKVYEHNWQNALFVIHDFWRREKYHVVLDFMDEVESTENLVVLKIKENIDMEHLQEHLQTYASVTA